MKYLTSIVSSLAVASAIVLFSPGMSEAGVDLPWSSTFNCSDWTQSIGQDNLQCDGFSLNNYAYSNSCGSGPALSQMNGDGNAPVGGGKGFRAAIQDGRNAQAATPYITFNTPQREFWVRWYQRWPSTASLSSPGDGIKLIYYSLDGQDSAGYIAMHDQDMQLYTQSGGTKHQSHYATTGSSGMFGGSFGDNTWHAIEMHFRASSSYDAVDGLWEVWVDGTLVGSFGGIDFFADFTRIAFNVNQQITTNPAGICNFIDYDDFVVQNTGYIGLDGAASPNTPPK